MVEGLLDTREDENPAHARGLRRRTEGHSDPVFECERLTAEQRPKGRRIAQTVPHIPWPIPTHDLWWAVHSKRVSDSLARLNKSRRHSRADVGHGRRLDVG